MWHVVEYKTMPNKCVSDKEKKKKKEIRSIRSFFFLIVMYNSSKFQAKIKV